MDGFREANNFGFGQTSQFDNFHVKGASNYSWGMKDRLSRIFNPKTGRAVMLAFDHGFIMGPTSGLERIDLNIVPLVQYADCIMCTRGILQTSIPANINKPVCLRSDAGSTILTELNRNVLIDIEDAIRYNASAMAVMFSAGDGEHGSQPGGSCRYGKPLWHPRHGCDGCRQTDGTRLPLLRTRIARMRRERCFYREDLLLRRFRKGSCRLSGSRCDRRR